MYNRIILAYDGSTAGQKALIKMKELEQWRHAKLTLLTVISDYNFDVGSVEMGYMGNTNIGEIKKNLSVQLNNGIDALRKLGFDADGELLQGEIIREITRYANNCKADLIVVGHKHEKNLLRRWWSGSTAKSLVEEASCNVLVVAHSS